MTGLTSLGLHHLALQVADVAGVAAFYSEHLGLPELVRHHREDGSLRSVWLALRSGGTAADGFLAVEAAEVAHGRQATLGLSMVALRIAPSERAVVRAALARAGVSVERETAWTLYLRDPEGNLVGLSHHPDPAT